MLLISHDFKLLLLVTFLADALNTDEETALNGHSQGPHAPPQSTPVSASFFTPSEQVAKTCATKQMAKMQNS